MTGDSSRTAAAAAAESTEQHGLPRRRIVVAAGGACDAVASASSAAAAAAGGGGGGGGGGPSSPTPQRQRHLFIKQDDDDDDDEPLKGHPPPAAARRWRAVSVLRRALKRSRWSAAPLLLPPAAIASASLLLLLLLRTMPPLPRGGGGGSASVGIPTMPPAAASTRCSSPGVIPRRSPPRRRRPRPPGVILVASHLRIRDGMLRLRIIEHNLRMLSRSSSSSSSPSSPPPPSSGVGESPPPADGPPPRRECVLIFSMDEEDGDDIRSMVDDWRNSTIASSPALSGMMGGVVYVPNDPVLVDASKWMRALRGILPRIRRADSRVMLMNDSFLLTRDVPEMWDETGGCGGEVCGLAWTGDGGDPGRHVQSYLRTLSSCAVERYMAFYERNGKRVRNVNELITLFEVNLDWARRGGGGGLRLGGGGGEGGGGDGDGDADVSAMYDYAGAHPDDDGAQRALLSRGYPAIKLKKFFVTDDPWLTANETSRPELPPTFSVDVYRRTNHDLNHLGDSDLRRHFATSGKHEDRIYSGTLPLVMKGWMREELVRMEDGGFGGEGNDGRRSRSGRKWRRGSEEGGGGESTIAILEDYLAALNRDVIGGNVKQ